MCKDMSFSHTLSQTNPSPFDARTVYSRADANLKLLNLSCLKTTQGRLANNVMGKLGKQGAPRLDARLQGPDLHVAPLDAACMYSVRRRDLHSNT